MTYPNPVEFVLGVRGEGGVVLRWPDPPEPCDRFVVFRSGRVIGPDQTEAFYAGELTGITRVSLPGESRTLVDKDGPEEAWYLVLGERDAGDLYAVALRCGAMPKEPSPLPDPAPDGPCTHDHQPYRDFPELVYRDDDPVGQMKLGALAKTLSKQYGD